MDVVLVDEQDHEIGLMEKLDAHRGNGMLHRAVSVIIYRETENGKEILLQKRGMGKPLWPLFWSNTICTHPLPGETYGHCAIRRLREEMGIIVTESEMIPFMQMQYSASYNGELSENELDTVFIGKWNGKVKKDNDEAAAYKWISIPALLRHMKLKPEVYTPWFHIIVASPEFVSFFQQSNNLPAGEAGPAIKQSKSQAKQMKRSLS